MMIDNKDVDLILSMSRLWFAKQSGLLSRCKVPYGCQAHLPKIMKMVFCKIMKVKCCKVMKVAKISKMEEKTDLAGSLRLLSSSRSYIS